MANLSSPNEYFNNIDNSNWIKAVPFTAAPSAGGSVTRNKGANFNDNIKLTFGDPAIPGDLEIYHDTLNIYINDTGTGNLVIGAENFYVKNWKNF